MVTSEKIKLTKRQKEIIEKCREGWMLFTGRSEATDRFFYGISKGYDNIWFNQTLWCNLFNKGLIHQQQSHPFNYELTELGETINL